MNPRIPLLGSTLLSFSQLLAADSKPNIVLILADDMRGSAIGCLDKEHILTPNLDRLAAQSVVFTSAHIMGGTSGAVSMPSRAMLMSGQYLYDLVREGETIPEAHTTIGEALAQAGYDRFHTGKWHNDRAAFNRCFNGAKAIYFGGMADHWNVPLHDYDPTAEYGNRRPVIVTPSKSNEITWQQGEYQLSGRHSVDIFTKEAVDYIRQQQDGQPFFLSVSYMSPHDPRTMPEEYLHLYDSIGIALPPNFLERHPFDNGELIIRDEQLAATPRQPEEIKRHIREYYAMITHLDHRVGEIVEALQAKGLYDNTILVFAGDNGLAVGQHGLMGKQNLYEHSTGVPLLIKVPGHEAGRTSNDLCYLTDVLPTLCEMAGVPVPPSADGVSLLPAIRENKSMRDYLYLCYKDNQRAVTDGRWKLIEYQVNGKRATQLFDLSADPWETTDLSGDRKQAARIRILRAQMLVERQQTHDNSAFWAGFEF